MDNLFFLGALFSIALPVGGSIGVLSGWLTKRLLHETWQNASSALLDALLGVAGLILGAVAARARRSGFDQPEWLRH